MDKKKIILFACIIFIIIILIIILIFNKNTSKLLKSGNNMNSQEIVDYILNISSYETNITVEVTSNKNYNKYIIKQEYISPSTSMQEVIEPSNIAGVRFIKEENTLRIENTALNLSKIFENYSCVTDNCLDLSAFIEDYKSSNNSTVEEEENQVIMKTQSSNDNKYTKYRTLYIDKETIQPTRLEIKDDNQNTTVNILYNEVKIN